jgi:GNAT superfamily N-acetyltransferase
MSLEHLQIRPAVRSDVSAIFSLVCELADYEELRHTVEATEADLHQHLFGECPAAEVLLALEQDMPVGIALFFTTFSTFIGKPVIFVEDLYVRPEHRGHGIGRALLKSVARVAVERKCGRLEWSVLRWNEPAIRFYQSLGAKPLGDWTMYRLMGDALTKAAEV